MSDSPTARLIPGISVYGGGLVIGLTLVSFPASSAVLREMHGFSDSEYGAIYLPQLVAAVAGAVAGGMLGHRLGLRTLYLVALGSFAAAQALLAASIAAMPAVALTMIMLATASFGFGFGFGGGPLNAFAALLFPRRATTALTALHMTAGAGLTAAPAFFAAFAAAGRWILGPVLLLAVTMVLIGLSLKANLPNPPRGETEAQLRQDGPLTSGFFWLCAAVATTYSIAEATFSNWAIIYLSEERMVPLQTAALALTGFWGALTIGRLIASILVVRASLMVFLLGLPVLMAMAFAMLPFVSSSGTAIAFFAFAGFACSAFFPMLVAFTAQRFPAAISWIASMLTAAMMVGVGIGSYAVGALRGEISISELYHLSIAYPLTLLVLILIAVRLQRARAAMKAI